MSRRRLDVDLRRRGPRRQSKTRILVVCEGEVTEPEYLRALAHRERNPLLHVEPFGPAGVPLTVVQKAIAMRNAKEEEAKAHHDENLRWDEVWVVHDHDDHPNISKAHQLATRNHIEVAYSNPSFELWALLHFQEQRAHVHRTRVRDALKKHLPRYDKLLDFEKVHKGYDDARSRAEALDVSARKDGEPGRNPSTDVYRLTERLRRRD